MKSIILTPMAAAIFSAVGVSAHGYVSTATLDGQDYPGYDPYTVDPPPDRIFRKIAGNGPVMDVTSVDLQCGGFENSGSAPAVLTASPVTPGTTQSLQWTKWPDSHKGPTITYMAKCPGDCADFDPGTEAVWFKIAEDGKHEDGSWASDPMIEEIPYEFTIPTGLAAGNYVVRHELWALHSAYEYPGAQIYPSCFQVNVVGDGTQEPTELVAFPGEYTPDTPGIVYDVYQSTEPYPIPGPPVWTGS